ncbi:MAG TPA: alpha/beta fold hydrolase [Gaiellaceae bacterium]|nr:alpha/beta fold hydrolase [Gaiellaceae bacterium]
MTVRRVLKWVGVAVLVLLAILAALVLWPASTKGLASTPKPVTDYQRATAAVERIRADERDDVIQPCRSRVLTHGEKTERAVVLVHGLTNCPAQWERFAREVYERGWNVLVLRLPEHGLGDPATGKIGSVSHLKDLDAEKLARYADQAVDIGRGLGEHTDVIGLSLGGTVAAWIAQERTDVDRVVAIAPAIGMPTFPYAFTWGITNLFEHLPDISVGGVTKLAHEYQGWSTGGIGDTFVLGKFVREEAGEEEAAAPEISVMLNPNDETISNPLAEDLVERWRAHGHDVTLYWLPKAPALEHDVIDPGQPWARPAFVYPKVRALLEGTTPSGP